MPKCTACAIVRPNERLNIIDLSNGFYLAFCGDNDMCRLEELAIRIGLGDGLVRVVNQSLPLTLKAEEELLKRILG